MADNVLIAQIRKNEGDAAADAAAELYAKVALRNYVRIECGKCRAELGWTFRAVVPRFSRDGDTLQDVLCDTCYDEELS